MKNREIDFSLIENKFQGLSSFWREQLGVKGGSIVVGRFVGQAVADNELSLPDGRSLNAMAKLAAAKIVGGVDPDTRKAIGGAAVDAFFDTLTIK